MSGDARGLSVELLALKALQDRVAERIGQVKHDLASVLDVGDRKTATLLDTAHTKVGTVTFTKPRVTAVVVDDDAFAEWVGAEVGVDAVVATIRAKSWAQKQVLDGCVARGEAVTVDGEVVPGVVVRTGEPYLSARLDADALPALVDAIRASVELAITA